jgi:hypothetical protein
MFHLSAQALSPHGLNMPYAQTSRTSQFACHTIKSWVMDPLDEARGRPFWDGCQEVPDGTKSSRVRVIRDEKTRSPKQVDGGGSGNGSTSELSPADA